MSKFSLLRWKFSYSTSLLNYFIPMFHFYTLWKRQKTFGFLTFLGSIEIEYWAIMGWLSQCNNYMASFWCHHCWSFKNIGSYQTFLVILHLSHHHPIASLVHFGKINKLFWLFIADLEQILTHIMSTCLSYSSRLKKEKPRIIVMFHYNDNTPARPF